MATIEDLIKDAQVLGLVQEPHRKILTKECCAFLVTLHRTFNATRKQLLHRRVLRQAEIDKGVLPDFLPETKHIRVNDTWRGADPARGLVDRRVEITGPIDRKMVVNALNADVWTYMADFEGMGSAVPGEGIGESVTQSLGGTIMGNGANISVIDSNSPTWDNVITGQVNLYDAIRRQVDFKLNGKDYKLRTDRALPTLIVRYVPHTTLL